MKQATKRLILNATLQERSVRLKDTAKLSAAKKSNETLQERSKRLENAAKRYVAKKLSKTCPQEELVDLKNKILSHQKAKKTTGKI
jgi:hypothetical protein